MKLTNEESTVFVRRQDLASRLLSRTFSSGSIGPSLRHKTVLEETSEENMTSFEKFAAKGKFDEIEALLSHTDLDSVKGWLISTSRGETDPAASDSEILDRGSESTDEEESETKKSPESTTALHIIMKHRPPVAVVDLLCRKLQALMGIQIPEDCVDKNGMNPLHLAVAHGCDTEVVRRLMKGSTEDLPAFTIDKTGRLPLHWACTNTRKHLVFFGGKQDIDNSVKNAYLLIRSCHEGKCFEDKKSQTPLQLAIEYRADERIVDALKRLKRRQLTATMSGFLSSSVHSCPHNSGWAVPERVVLGGNVNKEDDDDMSSIGGKMPSNSNRSRTLEEEYLYVKHTKPSEPSSKTPVNPYDDIKDLEDRLADCLAAFDEM